MLVVHTAAEPPNHGKTNLQTINSTWKSKIALNESVITKIVAVRVLRSMCSRWNHISRLAAKSFFVMVFPAESAIADDEPTDFLDPFGLDKKPLRKYHCDLFGTCYRGPALDTKQVQCTREAMAKNVIAFGTDALGAIPGEGQALAVAQLSAGGVGFVNRMPRAPLGVL
jgi:hypothetical protein